jgi:hypothetical protein
MPFQPFGYPFEIRSPRSPKQVKLLIRSRTKGWFDPKNGARGWIIGPFVCLWFSAFNQHGPMLFGVISGEGTGTRVHGRAGSDLNGVAYASLLLPVMVWALYGLIAIGLAKPSQMAPFALLILGVPLIYWIAHKDRREAEPLVRFLNNTISPSGTRLRRAWRGAKIRDGLSLSIGGDQPEEVATAHAIHDALVAVGPGSYAILGTGEQTYIQTAARDGGFVVERRDGGGHAHHRAVRRTRRSPPFAQPHDLFDQVEVNALFIAYAAAGPDPSFVSWEPIAGS